VARVFVFIKCSAMYLLPKKTVKQL
jgi:hypothetical protein